MPFCSFVTLKFISRANWNLGQPHVREDLCVRQLIRETLAISRFEQARPESAMHLDGASDYATRQLIKFHLRALRVLRGGNYFSTGPSGRTTLPKTSVSTCAR